MYAQNNMRSCFSCHIQSPQNKRKQTTLKTASNKALRILLQQPNVPRVKKQLIQRELRRRNKENYGYELAKMFGVTPPPTNKIRVAHANVISRIVKQSGVPLRNMRISLAPEHTGQFTNKGPTKSVVPKAYRFRRKLVRAGFELLGLQTAKQLQSLQRANNYATGRSSKKPANSTMRYYFRIHPRAISTMASSVNNIRRALKEHIQSNLFEYMPVPNRNNMLENWEILTNRNEIRNLNNLRNKMNKYRLKARNTWARYDRNTFDRLYNRVVNRNKYGFYYR